MDAFSTAWGDLLAAVAALDAVDFMQPSGCARWRVRDLVCHLVIDAQDVLITLATPAEGPETRDAASYWTVGSTPPTGEDPLDALTVRLAAAYEDPTLLQFHLDDVGSAAGRAAGLADRAALVRTQDQVLSVGAYLDAYVLEATVHHLDLVAHLDRPGPGPVSLAAARGLLDRIAGVAFPAGWPDTDVLRVGTGRRSLTAESAADLGELAHRIPLILG